MARTKTLADVVIDVEAKPRTQRVRVADDPFLILVAGDFSGGVGRNRRPIAVDRDNFDQVMGLIAPQLRFGGAGPIEFHDLDDFHPDSLFQRIAAFQSLRDLRKRLADSSTFRAAAEEIAGPAPAAAAASQVANLSGADLLRMLTGEAAPVEPQAPRESAWNQMLREMTKGYTSSGPDPRQAEWVARTDATIASEMRSLMHHPRFQSLEAAWRGLHFLVRRVETGENLKIYLMDLPHAELSAGGLGDLGRALDQEPWSVVAGLYYFGAKEEELLARIAGMAQDAGAPFLAGLAPEMVGLSDAFESLRTSLKAQWIGLALPRFLLRLPYGEATLETESFAFEEMPTPPEHERYLWGHPALACACLLADAFERDGWQMHPQGGDIEGLPAHVFQSDGESELKPCAEILLTDGAAEILVERGFMPLASIKGTDRVRLLLFQSMAKPNAPILGRWQ